MLSEHRAILERYARRKMGRWVIEFGSGIVTGLTDQQLVTYVEAQLLLEMGLNDLPIKMVVGGYYFKP